MGKTFADFYHVLGKNDNMKVAYEVKARDFIQIFIEKMKLLSRASSDS